MPQTKLASWRSFFLLHTIQIENVNFLISLDIETAVNAFIAILVPTILRQKYKNHTSHDTLLH
jgi:hypothetical protein